MSSSIMDEIRDSFRRGNTLTKLIYVNLAVYVAYLLAFVVYFLFVPDSGAFNMTKAQIFEAEYLKYIKLSSDLNVVFLRPWTLVTYMFSHFQFFHILFNLLVLFWFGQIFLRYLSEKQLLTTYLLGGLSGAALYLLSYNLLPGLSTGVMLGASASIMAVVMSISFYHPDYVIRLFFIGEVKLKYVALFYVALDVLQIPWGNAGGHIAHLGGALYGYFFAVQLKRGKDAGKGFGRVLDSFVALFQRKPKMKVAYKNKARFMTDDDYNQSKAATQKEVDRILDKIAKSGYNSLTKKEKEILFKMGNKG